MKKISILCLTVLCFFIHGCSTTARQKDIFDKDVGQGQISQVQIRQMQTRYFDIDDKEMAMQAVISTLQDLGFMLDKSSFELGSISASKYTRDLGHFNTTISVVPRSAGRMAIRVNSQLRMEPLLDPLPYQQFFNALEKSLFLEAHDAE